jgi:hypothetical protein
MRPATALRAALAIAAVASAGFLAAPASAYCDTTLYQTLGYCNACSVVGGPYNVADRALKDKLPPLDCVA